MDFYDFLHLLGVRELDIVEDTPAQEGVGQLLLCIGGNDDHRALLGLDGLLGLRHIELHPVQLPQQVVGKLQIGLVHLIDEQDHLLFRLEGLAQLAQIDILGDIVHGLAKLAVVKTLHHVVDIQAVLGLGSGFDAPGNELPVHGFGNGLGQHSFAGTRLALDQQGLAQGQRNIDRLLQLLGGHIGLGSAKGLLHGINSLFHHN